MPTALPTPASRPAPVRRLSWPDSARILILVARLRLLDWRAHRLVDRGAGLTDGRLLRLMRRWLALHERIGALLPGMPEPEHVREVRVILAGWDRTTTTVTRKPRARAQDARTTFWDAQSNTTGVPV